MALYRQLAQRFIDDIQRQHLPSGSRLPALRTLAKQQQVSMTTATKAYEYLQETGWIYARPQAGYFVSGRSESVRFPALSRQKMESRDPNLFAPKLGYSPHQLSAMPLGTAVLAPELLPDLALQRTIKRITQRSSQALFQYPELQVQTLLRRAISEHFREEYFPFREEELVITNSCLEAVRLAVETVSESGDTLAVSSPCFNGLLDLLSALSRNVIEIPLSHEGLDLQALETCMAEGRVKAVLLSTSHINPLGMTLPTEQKKALAELAERYQTPIIEDDIYLELSHQKPTPIPAKYWDKSGWILWCSSISKTLAPGLRLGWCLPGRFQAAYFEHHSRTSLGVNSLIQASIAEFFLTGDYHKHLTKTRITLQNQLHQYRHLLQENLPSDAVISQPSGGLVLWVRVPNLDSQVLQDKAQKLGIDIRSGVCFSTHRAYLDCFRVNCGWPLYNKEKAPSLAHKQLRQIGDLITVLLTSNTR